jgi:hypothetical protein
MGINRLGDLDVDRITLYLKEGAGIATGRPRGRSSSPGRLKSFPHVVQTGSGVHQWVPGALSPGVKRPGLEADHSSSASAEVQKMWICTSTPPYAFMA